MVDVKLQVTVNVIQRRGMSMAATQMVAVLRKRDVEKAKVTAQPIQTAFQGIPVETKIVLKKKVSVIVPTAASFSLAY